MRENVFLTYAEVVTVAGISSDDVAEHEARKFCLSLLFAETDQGLSVCK